LFPTDISSPYPRLKCKPSEKTGEAGGRPGLRFDPEDAVIVFLQNIGISPDYTALQLRRLFSSKLKLLLCFAV
jgi:hypothetical protein